MRALRQDVLYVPFPEYFFFSPKILTILWKALFLSPKNSTDGVLAVLAATDCTIWVNPIDAAPLPLVKEVLDKREMTLLQLPLLEELLCEDSTNPFPYNKSFNEAENEPFCFLHTSGSTGHPKPIPWSNGLIGTMDAIRLLPPVGENADLVPWTSGWDEGDKIYSSFPMSHVSSSFSPYCLIYKVRSYLTDSWTDLWIHRVLVLSWIS